VLMIFRRALGVIPPGVRKLVRSAAWRGQWRSWAKRTTAGWLGGFAQGQSALARECPASTI